MAGQVGFAALVAATIVAGLVVAITVGPPTEIPTVALRASAVYRVEVGGAIFLGLYIATMAFALALQNRGFTEFGAGGVRAQELAAVSENEDAEDFSIELLEEVMGEVRDLRAWREEVQSVGG